MVASVLTKCAKCYRLTASRTLPAYCWEHNPMYKNITEKSKQPGVDCEDDYKEEDSDKPMIVDGNKEET